MGLKGEHTMIDLFWGCLIGGIFFALATLLLGGVFHKLHGFRHALRFHGFKAFHPTTVVGAVTAFGGAGILLAKYTPLEGGLLLTAAAMIALILSIAVHFGYVLPMDRAESSIGFSIQDYYGMSGLITVPVPARGHGQIMVKMGASNTCQIAASFDGKRIPKGSMVVVVEVRDGVLYVTPIDID
jgi:hypothetical protein